MGGVQTGAGGLKGDVIGLSTTEVGRPLHTGAETEAGEQSDCFESDSCGILFKPSVCSKGEVSPQRQQEVSVT